MLLDWVKQALILDMCNNFHIACLLVILFLEEPPLLLDGLLLVHLSSNTYHFITTIIFVCRFSYAQQAAQSSNLKVRHPQFHI